MRASKKIVAGSSQKESAKAGLEPCYAIESLVDSGTIRYTKITTAHFLAYVMRATTSYIRLIWSVMAIKIIYQGQLIVPILIALGPLSSS